MGSSMRVSVVVVIRLLMIMMVSGCWILEFGLVVNSSGINLNVVIDVVINIGCNCCFVFWVILLSRFMFLL